MATDLGLDAEANGIRDCGYVYVPDTCVEEGAEACGRARREGKPLSFTQGRSINNRQQNQVPRSNGDVNEDKDKAHRPSG